MKKFVRVLLVGLGVLALAFSVVAVLAVRRPDTFHVERSLVIASPIDNVAPHVTDLRKWHEWSPWSERDANMHTEFSTPSSGVGAWYEWDGNDEVGAGRMDITDTSATHVTFALTFIRPFEGKATTTLRCAPEGNSTRVTWVMDNQESFIGKVMGLFMDMDAMIGKDFEKGLANLAARSN